jgi:hypothetical protein
VSENRVLHLPTPQSAVNIDYTEVASAPASTGSFTVEFWARFEPDSPWGRPFSKRGCSCGGLTLNARDEANAFIIQLELGGVGGWEVPFPKGEWHHFAVAWSGTVGRVEFFLDGEPLATSISGSGLPGLCGVEPLRFAEMCGRGMKGSLDNIRYWSVARTAGQIQSSYRVQYTPDDASQQIGLIGSWTFDNGSPSDGTGNNPMGVLQGSASIIIDNDPPFVPKCPSDIDQNGRTDGIDLAIILGRWGTNPKDYPRADTNQDSTVDATDLSVVLAGWGKCP